MSIQLPVADKLQLKIEDGYTATGPIQMTDSGDNQTFNSGGTYFSLCDKDENGVNRTPVVKPNGLINGCYISPSTSGTNDTIDIASGLISISGLNVSVAGLTDFVITRPSAGNSIIISITADSLGTVVAIYGTQATTLSTSRGGVGAPPFIPADSVELGQLTISSSTPAPLTNNEVKFSPELFFKPYWDILPYSASIKFKEPLNLIHSGSTTRKVFINYSEPQTVSLDITSFTPPSLSFEYDAKIEKLSTGKSRDGKASLILSPNGADITRRINETVRLVEFMPESNGTLKELYYAKIITNINYLPGELMGAEMILLPIKQPSRITI